MSIYSTLKCSICDMDFHNTVGLSRHIGRTHSCPSQIYYDLYIKKEGDGICKECGNPTKFVNLGTGYQTFCGISCANAEKLRNNWLNPKYREKRAAAMVGNTFSVGRPMGSKNKNPYPRSEAVLNRYKNNPPPSWEGKFHTEEYKKHMSELMIARIEMEGLPVSWKGKFKPQNPDRYQGDPTNIVYRSGLELRMMRYLDTHSQILWWESEERFIKYHDPVAGRIRRYFPDFCFATKTNGTFMVEVKPFNQTLPPTTQPHKDGRKNRRYIKEATTFATNVSKWEAAKEYCADRKWTFKIITEKDLGGYSKTGEFNGNL